MEKKIKTKIVGSLFSAILIIGGFFLFNIPKSLAASDEPTWTTSAHTLPTALDSATSVQSGNKIYVLGGSTEKGNTDAVYIGTIGNDDDVTWTTSAHTLPLALSIATAAISGDQIYVMGGYDGNNDTDAVYIGTIGNDGDVTWTTSAHTLPLALNSTTAVISGNHIYVMGGYDDRNANADTDAIYIGIIGNDGDVTWTTSAHTLPLAMDSATAAISGNQIYVMGGEVSSDNWNNTDAVYIGTIGNDGDVTWTTSAHTLPTALDSATSVQSGNYIYVMGGWNSQGIMDTVYVGTIGNDGDVTWATSAHTLPLALNSATAAISGDHIYVMGGHDDRNTNADTDAVYIGTIPQTPVTQDDNSDSNSDQPQKAKISSWKASQYTDQSRCAARMQVTIKGKHFKNNATVKINGQKASSIKVKNSENITANFCLTKLLDNQASRKRDLTVTNPEANTETADKQINLNHIDYNLTATDFDPQTTIGITNIQKALVQLGYLDQQNITGIYGPITTQAVKKFQAANGLPQTGTVGPLTKAKLGEKG